MADSARGEARHVRAVLWDVDGTLVDSMEYHWLSWREALEAEGYHLTRPQFTSTFGMRNDEILRTHFGPQIDRDRIERISRNKEHIYRELVRTRGIEPLPGVRRWLDELKDSGWRQAIASSAPLLNTQAIMAALDIAGYFAAIVSADEVERGKPDPQIFLLAASRLGSAPAGCVVVEDAPAGIEAARRAGMRSIGVLTTHPTLDADLVTTSLADLPGDAFDRLLERGERIQDRP